MNIVFICGSLEFGKDGVGDYVRLLSAQILKEGHQATVIALNDNYVTESFKEEQISKGEKISCYRIASKTSDYRKLKLVKSFIKNIDPEWISLQYVGFSYHRYGIAINLFFLRIIIGKRKLHIMFHELWCGMSKRAKLKEKIMGRAQYFHLRILNYFLSPERIFTSIKPYAKELDSIKIQSQIVPIFSNIDLDEQGNEEDYLDTILKSGLSSYLKKRNDYLILGFFGSIYNRSGLKDLIDTTIKTADNLKKKILILSIGNNRSNVLEEILGGSKMVSIVKTGPLNVGMINRMLMLVDLGILTTKADCLNKSGTGIALMDRNIPVLISSKDKTFFKLDKEIIEGAVYQINGVEDVLKAINRKKSSAVNNRLLESANSYINLSNKIKNNH